MSAQPASSRAAGRRKRGSLSREEVLDAAERTAAEGADALTMRGVAARAGCSPMALYRYFPTKESLTDALIDRVLERVATSVDGTWAQRLRALAIAHAAVLEAHPWAVPHLFASPAPGPATARLGEAFLGILADGGLRGELAVAAFGGILALNYGRTGFATRAPGTVVAFPPADAFPHTAASASALGDYASQGTYERALDLLLAGTFASALPAKS